MSKSREIRISGHACMHVKSLQSCPAVWDPMDCSLPDSSVHGTLQARILESVAIPFSRGSSQPRDQNCISMSQALGGGFFTTRATWEGSPSKLLSKGSLSCCKHLKKVCVNLLKFLALDNSSLEG